MDKKQIRKEITTLINSIKEYSDSIREKENIPQLELELLLHKVEKLYQKSIVLNHLNSMDEETPAVAKTAENPEKTTPPVVEKPGTRKPENEAPAPEKPVEKTREKEAVKTEPEKTEQPEAKPETIEKPVEAPKTEAKTEIKTEEPKEEEPQKEEPKPGIKQEDKKPVDLFESEIPPATEKPKAEKKPEKKEEKPPLPSLNKIQKPPVPDLRAAIGFNDKFQFANELFAGEMKEYDIAIQQLNSAETMESASEYFKSLEQLYGWDPENETVKRLYDLVDRRYTSY